MDTPKPRTVALAITLDRGMLIVNNAGNAGTFVLAMPDDLSPVSERLRELCIDISIAEHQGGGTQINWGETVRNIVGALTAPTTEGK